MGKKILFINPKTGQKRYFDSDSISEVPVERVRKLYRSNDPNVKYMSESDEGINSFNVTDEQIEEHNREYEKQLEKDIREGKWIVD